MVYPSGVVLVALNQPFSFTCVARSSVGIVWLVDGHHVSEGDLNLQESISISLDPMRCVRQTNLTGIATSLAHNISLTCLPIDMHTSWPSPQIRLLVEGIIANYLK